ncbi:MAG: hypothetical protein M3R24_12350 [Chloroflexota bacterium]|nr:hypothetical protein [Chloroflexota bacterium]
MVAVAAYVRTLTKEYGGGRAKLERETSIRKDRIREIEAGVVPPSLEELFQLMATIGGSYADIQRLLLTPATEEDGVRLAKEHLVRTARTPLKQQIDRLDTHELVHLLYYVADRLEVRTSAADT